MSKRRIVSAAHLDFLEVVEYYLAKNEALATDFVDCVEAAYTAIEANPERPPRLETIQTERELRRVQDENDLYRRQAGGRLLRRDERDHDLGEQRQDGRRRAGPRSSARQVANELWRLAQPGACGVPIEDRHPRPRLRARADHHPAGV